MNRSVRSRQIALAGAICGAALAFPASAAPAGLADADTPRGAVAGFMSPARATLTLAVTASDAGVGLATATATVDGRAAGAVRLGAESCAAVPPAEPPGGACPASVSSVALIVDLQPFAAGRHQLQVRVADAAGNVSLILDETLEIAGPPPVYTPSVSLQIGNGGSPGGDGSLPGTAAAAALACLAPRLSMVLDQRPLRVTQAGVPVLRSGRRYRFRGRLTCRVGAGRRTAPAGVPVRLVNRLGPGGRIVLNKTGLVTRRAGRLTIVVAYRSSRTLVFRTASADGSASRVQIPIIVARAAGQAKAKR